MSSFIAKLKVDLMSAGGLTYHLRARRYSEKRWRPFRASVANWLREWQPRASRLIIFGSSAGYTLNSEFLRRFDHVAIIEPDFFARFLFRRRFAGTETTTIHAASLLKNVDADEWRSLIDQHPDTAFLFSNVVGQMIHIKSFSSESVEERVSRLFTLLTQLRVPWASYHDILSTSSQPRTLASVTLHHGADSLSSIAHSCFHPDKIKIIDHGTLDATYALEKDIACAWWEIEPRRYHLVGWIAR